MLFKGTHLDPAAAITGKSAPMEEEGWVAKMCDWVSSLDIRTLPE